MSLLATLEFTENHYLTSGMVWGIKRNWLNWELNEPLNDKINICFRHSTHIFEKIEEFEIDEILSSQIIWLKNEMQKAVYKQNTYVQTCCLISLTLNVEQKRNTESTFECKLCMHLFCVFRSSLHVAAENSDHLGYYVTLSYGLSVGKLWTMFRSIEVC